MLSSTAYTIRRATAADGPALRHLAGLDSQPALPAGEILVGELEGEPAAAIAIETGRVVADPFRPTARLASHLRMRASGIRAAEREPLLSRRIRAGIGAGTRTPLAA